MEDAFLAIGGLAFIALFAYAMIREGRKQRAAKRKVFRDFAARSGLRYQKEDDGIAQEFAGDFAAIGRFRSSSIGKVIPQDVVTGTIDGWHVIFFRHWIHLHDGYAREWFVAGVTASEPIADRCAVQFCEGRGDNNTMGLDDPVMKELDALPYTMVVRAPTPQDIGRMSDDGVLRQMAGFAANLSFRPEIQVRGQRIVAYLAERNARLDGVQTLRELFEFVTRVARV